VDIARLIEALSSPDAYPAPVAEVLVRQTHISVVFLAGPYAYKIKKPVDTGFLDFRSLEDRRRFCAEEVRLNRRLAPSVYLGVVPVVHSGEDLRIEGQGEVVEWAVKMHRLPDEATLKSRIRDRSITVENIEHLARVVARFHARAETGEHIASFGRFEVVAGNARENYSQSASQVGSSVSAEVFTRLRALTEEWLARLRPLIAARAERGVPRDTHGDLHLDHVYLLPDHLPPDEPLIIDCIEFNERFRYADPVADMAFLYMDLVFQGRRDLAEAFSRAYIAESNDTEGQALLPFYSAYRAAVRAKVEGLKAEEPEVREADQTAARKQARGHWLLALSELEAPERRPCLILVGGLPGSGKSTLARGLSEQGGFSVIRSDVVRKELAGDTKEDIYSRQWTEKTYGECLLRAEALLFRGERVIIDATFRKEGSRRKFLEAARAWGVRGLLLIGRADPATVRARLAARVGDVSDADWAVYGILEASWDALGTETWSSTRFIDTTGTKEEALDRALECLRAAGLFGME
jgi:aminoglycoside phosphotransferase family enzyme/predicted kinase